MCSVYELFFDQFSGQQPAVNVQRLSLGHVAISICSATHKPIRAELLIQSSGDRL
jgi:hypothetical protein